MSFMYSFGIYSTSLCVPYFSSVACFDETFHLLDEYKYIHIFRVSRLHTYIYKDSARKYWGWCIMLKPSKELWRVLVEKIDPRVYFKSGAYSTDSFLHNKLRRRRYTNVSRRGVDEVSDNRGNTSTHTRAHMFITNTRL